MFLRINRRGSSLTTSLEYMFSNYEKETIEKKKELTHTKKALLLEQNIMDYMSEEKNISNITNLLELYKEEMLSLCLKDNKIRVMLIFFMEKLVAYITEMLVFP